MTIGGDDSRNLFPIELTARLNRRRFIGGMGAAAFAAAFLAACGGDEEPESTRRPRVRRRQTRRPRQRHPRQPA